MDKFTNLTRLGLTIVEVADLKLVLEITGQRCIEWDSRSWEARERLGYMIAEAEARNVVAG